MGIGDPTIGGANVEVDVKAGKDMIAKTRAIAKKAGQGAGFGFTKSFEDGMSSFSDDLAKGMEKAGKLGGKKFEAAVNDVTKGSLRRLETQIAKAVSSEDGFRQFAKDVGGANVALDRLGESLDRAASKGELSEEKLAGITDEITEWAIALSDLEEDERRAAEQTEKLNAESSRLSQTLKDVNLTLGSQKNYDVLIKNARNSSQALRDLEYQLLDLVTAGKISEPQFDVFTSRITDFGTEVTKAEKPTKAMTVELQKQTGILKGVEAGIDKVGSSWRRMDGTVRLVLTLIAAGASDIASLGSAAGAGLLSLGAAIGQLGFGALGMGVVFSRLSEDLDDLDPSLHSVAIEFDRFKQSFGGAADAIASGAFPELEGTFESLRDTVRTLEPALSKLGSGVGIVMDGFADTFKVTGPGFRELETFIDDAGDGFVQLGDVTDDFIVALLRGFNKANPLVEDLYDWLGRVIGQFDEFTQSSAFDDWVGNAQDVFGALSGVLDATARSMNDLSDSDSVARLIDMLDDLAAAIPPLFAALDVISVLNPLGLLVKVLSDLLVAVSPLFDPLEELAGSLNLLLEAGIDALVPPITALATALGFMLDLVPPEVVIGLVAALLTMKNLESITGAISKVGTSIYDFGLNIATLPDKVGKVKALGKGLGLAAVFAGVASAASGMGQAAELSVEKVAKLDAAFKSGSGGIIQFRNQLSVTGTTTEELRAHLDNTFSSDFFTSGRSMHGLADAIDGITFGLTSLNDEFDNNEAVYREWGNNLAEVAETDLGTAQEQFQSLVEGFGGGKEVIRELLEGMPEFEAKLRDLASATGKNLSEQELYNLAVGDMVLPMSEAEEAAKRQTEALAILTGGAADASGEISSLADQIRGFGSAELESREALRGFEEALDSLTESVEENGTSLDITEQAGRDNEAALDAVAQKALTLASATLEQTGSQDLATEALKKGRDGLIEVLAQLGITGAEAEAYADKLGLIPENIKTASDFTKDPQAQEYDDQVRKIPYNVTTDALFRISVIGYDDLLAAREALGATTGDYHISFGPGGAGGITAYAAGGLVNGARRALVGEAGPEAIVPLRRSLSMVDPAVRGLSAYAQGIDTGDAQSLGSGRSVVIQPGAIQINGALQPERVAINTVNRLAQRIGS